MSVKQFDPRIHIGEICGIYTIIDVLPDEVRDSSGHRIYIAKCNLCGYERRGTYSKIKNNTTKSCSHSIKTIKENERKAYDRAKIYTCINYGKEYSSSSRKSKYCSTNCQHEYLQKAWEIKWFAGEVTGNTNSIWAEPTKRVRNYLFKKYDGKCAKCGWGETNPFTGTVPLEIEHIDGDSKNTAPENVILLCSNCHSLTATYRGANRGHGRAKTWIPKPIEVDI